MARRKSAADVLQGSITHLLQRAVRMALEFHTEAAGAEGVTQRQYTVLAAAAGAEGQNQNDLVRATGIDRSTLAELVSRMFRRGLLQRSRSEQDARANTVSLTPAGQAALVRGKAAAAAADERLLALLSAKRRDNLVKILTGLLADAGDPGSAKSAKAGKKRRKKKTRREARDVGA